MIAINTLVLTWEMLIIPRIWAEGLGWNRIQRCRSSAAPLYSQAWGRDSLRDWESTVPNTPVLPSACQRAALRNTGDGTKIKNSKFEGDKRRLKPLSQLLPLSKGLCSRETPESQRQLLLTRAQSSDTSEHPTLWTAPLLCRLEFKLFQLLLKKYCSSNFVWQIKIGHILTRSMSHSRWHLR